MNVADVARKAREWANRGVSYELSVLAEFIAELSDVILEERNLMATKEEGNPCYDKAAFDEPLFVLRAQDALAPEIVREWAYRALKAGTPLEKVDEARRLADRMEDWQIEHSRKVPD